MDDRTVDRRSFLRRTGAAGLVGLSGVGSLQSPSRGAERDPEGAAERGGDQQQGAIEYMRAVLPTGPILSDDLVYRIVVVGGPIQPHERPPPLCFPEGDKQWHARGAAVVKPTETGLSGESDIGAVDRTRVHLEEPAEPGSVWRISGGEYCDGNARVTMHELPPDLSEYFSARMIDLTEEYGNQTAGTATAGNETVGNASVGNETAENESVGTGALEPTPGERDDG